MSPLAGTEGLAYEEQARGTPCHEHAGSARTRPRGRSRGDNPSPTDVTYVLTGPGCPARNEALVSKTRCANARPRHPARDLAGHGVTSSVTRVRSTRRCEQATTSTMDRARYIPALRFDALTRFFDPIVRMTTRERTFKQRLVEQVAPRSGQRILDVGCGTATLAINLKLTCPGAEIVGVDGDPKVLELARAKIRSAGLSIELHEGMAWDLPSEDDSLDHVVSSLVFHHLDRDSKLRTLRAAHRALREGGQLHIADWGRAHGLGMRLAFVAVQLLDGFETTNDSVAGLLPSLISQAGFRVVEETTRMRTPLGSISLYRGCR